MTLTDRIARAEARAKDLGAIVEVLSTRVDVPDPRMPFSAFWISSMEAKDRAAFNPPSGNPFAPYEEALFVENLDDNHVLIVNKFQMNPGHVLIITRAVEPQQAILSRADMAGISRLLSEIDGVMMYNGGRMAGASQDHRHLHLLPTLKLPLDERFTQALAQPGLGRYPPFAFPHALIRFDDGQYANDETVYALLRDGFRACGIDPETQGQSAPYNLLMTRRWLLVVPRSQQNFEAQGAAIPVHALHFGGLCGVRTPDQQSIVAEAGLAAILQSCAGAPVS